MGLITVRAAGYGFSRQASGRTYREDQGNASADGLRAVESGGLTEPETFSTGSVLPAQDGGTVKEDLNALAGWEGGGNAGAVVSDVDLGLGRKAWGGCQGGWLIGTVDHGGRERVDEGNASP